MDLDAANIGDIVMKVDEIREIMDCLPKGRTKFYYFKDRYALMLLAYLVGDGKSVRDIKGSRFGRLVRKPMVERTIQNSGRGRLTPEELGSIWPDRYHCYLLTLGMWGDRKSGARFYNQTSRPGWNLVLQLNFAAVHNRSYYRLVKPRGPHPFQCFNHPIASGDRLTLAWARMDMDPDQGEALIEEIQTDWIRRAMASRQVMTSDESSTSNWRPYVPEYVKRLGCDSSELSEYIDKTLKPHARIWDEAMLAAAIWFLKEEIGIRKIYYHTFEFGSQWKRITGSKPPRSLYTKLPDRFCFEKTRQVPRFLGQNNNRKLGSLINGNHQQFYLLDLEGGLK